MIRFFITRIYLRRIAVECITLFDKYDVDYWIDFGTLLGIIREDDIIFGDGDVDFIIKDTKSNHDKISLIKHDLKKKGYKLINMGDVMYRVIDKHGLYGDIYINKLDEKTKMYIGVGEGADIPSKFIGTPKMYRWKKMNLNVKVPQNIHETLEWRYGKDYMTPKHGFKGRCS